MQLEPFFFIISLLGVLQGFIIVALIWLKPGRKLLENRLLGLLFLLCSLVLLLITLINGDLLVEKAWMQITEIGITLTAGPLFYFYFRQRVGQRTLTTQSAIWHFFPLLIWLGYGNYCLLFGQPLLVDIKLAMLHLQAYGLYTGWYFFRNRKTNNASVQFEWGGMLLLFFLVLGVGQWARILFHHSETLQLIVPVSGAFSYYGITLIGFIRSDLLKLAPAQKTVVADKLPTSFTSQQVNHVRKLIEEKELFTDTQLTLNKLAYELDMHPNQLSEMIHRYFGKSFNDYINFHRVQKAIRVFRDPSNQHYTIEAIGQEAGFNSRSAFYRSFKKVTQQTPATFRQQIRS